MTPLVTIRPVCDAILLNILFPHLTVVRIEELSDDAGVVRICARAQSDEARCPACGNASTRVHGWYERQLADAPVAGRPVVIRLRVRKFICQTLGCARRIFTEQLAGLTVRHGRRSLLLFGLLATIAFAVAGRAGARLARRAAIAVSRSTLLRLVRAAPEPTTATPAVLGVDLSRRRDYPDVGGHWLAQCYRDRDNPGSLLPPEHDAPRKEERWAQPHGSTAMALWCRSRWGIGRSC